MSKHSFDTVLEYGTGYDGTGHPGSVADIGIVGDRIEHIGNLKDADSAQRINVQGLAVSPGFIDLHTHSDFTLIVDGSAESQVHQGVSTEVIGQCGHSVAPVCHHDDIAKRASGVVADSKIKGWKSFGEYLETLDSQALGVNVAAFVGHGTVHHAVMGDDLRLPEPEEVDQMALLVEQSI